MNELNQLIDHPFEMFIAYVFQAVFVFQVCLVIYMAVTP